MAEEDQDHKLRQPILARQGSRARERLCVNVMLEKLGKRNKSKKRHKKDVGLKKRRDYWRRKSERVRRGGQPLLLALVHKEEVVKVASVDLAVPPDNESLIIHKDQIGDQETETPLVDDKRLHYKVSDEVVQLLVAVKLRHPELAQVNLNNNQDRPPQGTPEPDLLQLKLVLLVPASHLANRKLEMVATLLDLLFHMHLSVGKPFQLAGKV
jgi:hypothetical protein